MGSKAATGLKRPSHPMPRFVREALMETELMEAYRDRPPYQRNDYVGWINRAKREDTKQRRLAQMLQELKSGDRYMKMPYRPRVVRADYLSVVA